MSSNYVQFDPNQVITNKDGIPIYGMDLELEAKKMAKYDKEKENDIKFWIEAVTGEEFKTDDFQEALKDGILLCKLCNIIRPGSVPKINNSKLPFMQMENIGYFLKAADDMGLQKHDAFRTVDLYEGKNLPQVIQTLFIFASVVQKLPSYNGPEIGIKIADKRNIEFTEEQLRRSSNTVGLQYEGGYKHDTGLHASREVVKTKNSGIRGATTQQMSGSIGYESGKSISNNIVKVLPSTHTPGSGLQKKESENSFERQQEYKYEEQPQQDGNELNDSVLDELEALAELRDQGILTQEEFEEKKSRILGL